MKFLGLYVYSHIKGYKFWHARVLFAKNYNNQLK